MTCPRRGADERAAYFSEKCERKTWGGDAGRLVYDFFYVFQESRSRRDREVDCQVGVGGGKEVKINFFRPGKIIIKAASGGRSLEKVKNQPESRRRYPRPEDLPKLWTACDFTNKMLTRGSSERVRAFKIEDPAKTPGSSPPCRATRRSRTTGRTGRTGGTRRPAPTCRPPKNWLHGPGEDRLHIVGKELCLRPGNCLQQFPLAALFRETDRGG